MDMSRWVLSASSMRRLIEARMACAVDTEDGQGGWECQEARIGLVLSLEAGWGRATDRQTWAHPQQPPLPAKPLTLASWSSRPARTLPMRYVMSASSTSRAVRYSRTTEPIPVAWAWVVATRDPADWRGAASSGVRSAVWAWDSGRDGGEGQP